MTGTDMRFLFQMVGRLGLVALLAAGTGAQAQNAFSAAVIVDDSVVTYYEVDQRVRLLEAFGTAGDLRLIAREQLIDERLQMAELRRNGIVMTDEIVEEAIEDFAGRTGQTLAQLRGAMAAAGIDEATVRDFVVAQAGWNELVRFVYGPRARVTEDDVDRALASGSAATGLELLVSELIIARPAFRAAEIDAVAERISQMTSFDEFADEARRLSVLPSAENGGRLGWQAVSAFPQQLRPLLLALDVGQVTEPIFVAEGEAVALFQLRGLREAVAETGPAAAIEFATYVLSGDRAAAELGALSARVDTCDDLYGELRGVSDSVFQRQTLPTEAIPTDIAILLTALDANEVAISPAGVVDGESVWRFVMLCGRAEALGEDIDRDAVRRSLFGERLQGYSDAFLADLRAAATIEIR